MTIKQFIKGIFPCLSLNRAPKISQSRGGFGVEYRGGISSKKINFKFLVTFRGSSVIG